MKYDYIIAGSGCAGLSLLYKLLLDPLLQGKSILVVEKERKVSNDRTWCFWESEAGPFESIVRHQWKNLIFKSEEFTKLFSLKHYKYKMIKGLDFYNFVLSYAAKFPTIEFKYENIKGFEVESHDAVLITENGRYTADYIFNSTSILNPEMNEDNTLLQHFMGWEIKTNESVFDKKVGTLMDFTVDQKHGTTFMYVLPISEKLALVEYTLFTKKLLAKDQYRIALKEYISKHITSGNYEIVDEEFGVIPMSLKKFSMHHEKKIINIGTAGGYTKASSGYTFQFVQKHTDKIISKLKNGEDPFIKISSRDKMFQWYDRTLLDVMLSNKLTGKYIFATMFKKLEPEKILKFLGNESNFSEDLTVMFSVPTMKFLTSALRQW